MPDEALISQIENILTEIVELGGANERTQIVPNLVVQDANPTGLTGFVIVSDDRDGDNILAKTVPSVVYSDNDLVNVLFSRGTEPIAFQQGSQSGSGDLWEVVPSTTTDIFYDKGDVGIGTVPATLFHAKSSGSAVGRIETTQVNGVARFEFLNDAQQWNVGVNASDEVTWFDATAGITPFSISPGQANTNMVLIAANAVVINDSGADVDFRVESDTDANNIFSDGGTNRVGIGTNSPDKKLHVGGGADAPLVATDGIYVTNNGATAIIIRNSTNDVEMLSFADTSQGILGNVTNHNLKIRTNNSDRITVLNTGEVGLNGITSPSTALDIGAGAIEYNEMTAPAAGAANTARDYAEDDGSGNTQRRIKFSSGNAVTIARDGGLATYTPTNVVTDRSYDANATSVAELADVLGTLIADFQAAGVLA